MREEIEALYQQGMSYNSIAAAVGISAPALWKIRHGETEARENTKYRLRILYRLRTMRSPHYRKESD